MHPRVRALTSLGFSNNYLVESLIPQIFLYKKGMLRSLKEIVKIDIYSTDCRKYSLDNLNRNFPSVFKLIYDDCFLFEKLFFLMILKQ